VCFSVLQRVAACCSVLQICDGFPLLDSLQIFVAKTHRMPHLCVLLCFAGCCTVLQCIAVCCSVLQCKRPTGCLIFVCCSVLQNVAVCRSVLQCVAVCCSMLGGKDENGCFIFAGFFPQKSPILSGKSAKGDLQQKVCCSVL